MLFPLLLATAVASVGQDTLLTAATVRAAATAVRTVDPVDEDFSDLQPLKKDLANTRVLVLGEQTHGDGTTMLAKIRLVKFLHKEMGFDVVIFEQDLLGVRQDMQDLKAGRNPRQLAGSLGTFGGTEFEELFRYVASQANTTKPLEAIGMDPWFVNGMGGNGAKRFGADVIAFFDAANPSILPDSLRIIFSAAGWPYLTAAPWAPPNAEVGARDQAVLRSVLTLLTKNRAALDRVHGAREVELLRRGLENRVLFARIFEPLKNNRRVEVNAPRDTLMGKTAAYLVNDYYKGRKVIIWASHSHVMRNGAELGLTDFTNMIEHLAGQVPSGLTSVGFTAHEGAGGVGTIIYGTVGASVPGSLEWAANESGPEYQWINLHRLPGTYRTKLWPQPQMRSAWKRHFDFVFYSKLQKPLTPRGPAGR